MIKKIYQKPEMAVEIFVMEDVVTGSTMNNAGEDNWENGYNRDDFLQ